MKKIVVRIVFEIWKLPGWETKLGITNFKNVAKNLIGAKILKFV
jgi:hypothetical protein